MHPLFEELDRQRTPMGEISLRRRRELTLEVDVYEAKLDEEYLMSSLFTAAEIELAGLGLAACTGSELDVVVGGLGLGYTAAAVLEDHRVRTLRVVEALPAVIGWHQRHLLPLGPTLTDDPRCDLRRGDFFELVGTGEGFGPPRRHHAILVDIDHAPDRLLHPSHAGLYEERGLARLADHLHPGGVFGLWSDDPPEDGFLDRLARTFSSVEAHVVRFANPYTEADATNTVYVATTPRSPGDEVPR